MPITISGSGTVTGLTAGGLPDGSIQAADLASGVGGKVLQVKNATKTGYQSFNNGGTDTFVDISGLSITITPSSTSNTLLVGYQISGSGSNNSYASVKCVYNVDGGSFSDTVVSDALSATNSDALIRASSSLDTYNDQGIYKVETRGVQFMHSPASTGTLIYKLQLAQIYDAANQYSWINRCTDIANKPRSVGISTLTIMEIVA